jgi:hypothetical protein
MVDVVGQSIVVLALQSLKRAVDFAAANLWTVELHRSPRAVFLEHLEFA